MESDFIGLLTQTVVIKHVSGTNQYNKPTYGPPVTYKAYIEGRHRETRDATGDTVTIAKTLYLDCLPPIGRHDEVTIDGRVSPIVTIETVYDESGAAYYTAIGLGE